MIHLSRSGTFSHVCAHSLSHIDLNDPEINMGNGRNRDATRWAADARTTRTTRSRAQEGDEHAQFRARNAGSSRFAAAGRGDFNTARRRPSRPTGIRRPAGASATR